MRLYKKWRAIILFFILFPLLGAACQAPGIVLEPVTLNYWGTHESEDAFNILIEEYRKTRPHVTILYRRFEKDLYERALLNALAEDRGPDIFSVPDVDFHKYLSKIIPLEKLLTLSILDESGVPRKVVRKSLTIKKFKSDFLDVVSQRVIVPDVTYTQEGNRQSVQDKIFGVPLYMDTLVMYYNKDLFEKAGLTELPRTWTQFLEAVKVVTKKNNSNSLLQSATALGTGNNVRHFFDILSLLMMQNGTVMSSPSGDVLFAGVPQGSDLSEPPALNAIQFYIDFASPFKESYTWNEKMPDSLSAFIQGRTAFYFGYADDYSQIKKRAPKLDFDVSFVPQIQGNREVNYGRYFVEVVSKKSKNQSESWDFLSFITQPDQLSKYLSMTKKPTPIRSLLIEQQEDVFLKVFTKQLLTTQNWYAGDQYDKAENAFRDMIEAIHFGKYEYMRDAVNVAASIIAEEYYVKRVE